MELKDPDFINLLQQGNVAAYEKVFTTYFRGLHVYAFLTIKEDGLAQEIVQQVFFKLWEKKEKLNIHTSLKAYLYTSVYNECLQYINRKKLHSIYTGHLMKHSRNISGKEDASAKAEHGDLEKRFLEALNELPEQCRTIFQLNRFEGLKYQEIAQQLGLSVKTVEAQMGKALKRLRISLAEFLP